MTPITGVSHDGRYAHLRLEGRQASVGNFAAANGLDFVDAKQSSLGLYWAELRHQQAQFFANEADIWQLSLPKWSDLSDQALSVSDLPYLMDWAGARYWVRASGAEVEKLKAAVSSLKGYLQSYSGDPHSQFPAWSPTLLRLHHKLKQAYDPAGILNPGRLFTSL